MRVQKGEDTFQGEQITFGFRISDFELPSFPSDFGLRTSDFPPVSASFIDKTVDIYLTERGKGCLSRDSRNLATFLLLYEPELTMTMSNKPCLLVADDDSGDLFLLRRAFRRAALDCEILEVHDGEQAVQYLSGIPPYDDRLRHPIPSLLVLDVKMPKMNGFDVLAWLGGRPYLEHLPVVMLSGSCLQDDAAAALHLGARDYLVKPADVNKMIELARELYHRWLAPVAPWPELVGTFSASSKVEMDRATLRVARQKR
jgi:CheY-like chemotaxis protein